MRSTALDTINAFAEQCGYKEFFDGEMLADAFKSGSPVLRSELWGWLAQALPKSKYLIVFYLKIAAFVI